MRHTTSSFSAAKRRASVESLPPENRTPNCMATLKKKTGLYACLKQALRVQNFQLQSLDCV
jgi:hypothetical protein